MTQYKDIALSFAGMLTGAVSLTTVNQVLSIVTALSTIALFGLAIVRAVIQTIEAIKKHRKGEATTEETLEKLGKIRDELEEEHEKISRK